MLLKEPFRVKKQRSTTHPAIISRFSYHRSANVVSTSPWPTITTIRSDKFQARPLLPRKSRKSVLSNVRAWSRTNGFVEGKREVLGGCWFNVRNTWLRQKRVILSGRRDGDLDIVELKNILLHLAIFERHRPSFT